MTSTQILDRILNKKGQFSSLVWRKPCKVYKNVAEVIEKETSANGVQIGAAYDNCKKVIEGRENGELPAENAGLNGLEWVQYPYITRNPKSNKEYLRITLTNNSHFHSKFFENGVETTKEAIIDKLTATERNHSDNMPLVMNIPLDKIINII